MLTEFSYREMPMTACARCERNFAQGELIATSSSGYVHSACPGYCVTCGKKLAGAETLCLWCYMDEGDEDHSPGGDTP